MTVGIISRRQPLIALGGSYHDETEDDVLKIPSLLLDPSAGMSACYWMRQRSGGLDTFNASLAGHSSDEGNVNWTIESNGSNGLDLWSGAAIITLANAVIEDQWQFCTFRHNGVTSDTFLSLDDKSGSVGWFPASNQGFLSLFGLFFGGRFDDFNGDIAHVKIWDEYLTGAQLQKEKLRYEVINRSGNVGWWPLDSRYGLRSADGRAPTWVQSGSGNVIWTRANPGVVRIFQTRFIPTGVSVGGNRNITATLVNMTLADIDSSLNMTRDLSATLVNVSAANIDTTLALQRDLSASLVDVAIGDLDSNVATDRDVIATLTDVTVADLDALLSFGADRDLNATLVNVGIADVDSTTTTDRNVDATLVDVAIAKLDATVSRARDIIATRVNVIVRDLNALVTGPGAGVVAFINIAQEIGRKIVRKLGFAPTETRRDAE